MSLLRTKVVQQLRFSVKMQNICVDRFLTTSLVST